MITSARFIPLKTKCGDTIETEYVNVNHIIRMYQEEDDIVVILTNGTNLLVTNTYIGHLLDKMNVSNQLHIYNK
jgi:UDP-N-acetylenolpyruvoylglucosamine reductase